MTPLQLEEAYDEARAKYEEQGMNNLSLAEMQDLIAGECWKDGSDPQVALDTARMYGRVDSARDYLVLAFNYED